jgi:hypothetical protein
MLIRLFAIAAVIAVASSAQAADVPLNTPASACTPDAATIKANRHVTVNGSVRHAAASVDRITLICPINSIATANTDWDLLLTYQDSTGTVANAFVRAQLLVTDIATQLAAPTVLATVTSNSSSVTTINTIVHHFTHTFDFLDNIYWVRIELDRSTTSQTEIAYSVALGHYAVSDIRLKHDIELLGRLDNGLGFYRFAYNGSDQRYVGVMAQEVEAIRPDAVVRGRDGYLRVSYARLGLSMQRYEDWLAAGAVIPKPVNQAELASNH